MKSLKTEPDVPEIKYNANENRVEKLNAILRLTHLGEESDFDVIVWKTSTIGPGRVRESKRLAVHVFFFF